MNKKTILVAITGVLLAVAGGAVGATLSRYQSMATTTPVLNVAKWYVKVGETDISQGETKNFTANIKWDENALVEENLMAPGSKGTISFDVVTTGTQVPIEYTLGINEENIESHTQITIEKVTATYDDTNEDSITLNKETDLENTSDSYTGNIPLDKIGKKLTIKIFVKWDPSGHDEDDTKLGAAATPIDLPLTFTASQQIAKE